MSIVIKFILYRLKRNDKGKESETLFLNTNFFITLRLEIIEEKLNCVIRWTKNKNTFSKKLILIPINKTHLHWSLLVVVNLGKFTKKDKVNGDNDETSYILLFNSLESQNKNTIRKSICQWLNLLYEKVNNMEEKCDMFDDLCLYDNMNSKFNIFKFITQVTIIY